MRNLILSLIKDKLQILTLFGAPWGSNGDQKGQKLPTSLKKTHKNRKFAQANGYFFMRNSMLSLIHYVLQFLIFGGGDPWGQKRSKLTHLAK